MMSFLGMYRNLLEITFLELNKEVVATGGFPLHYNIPFADLYMEVRKNCRKKGFGSFLIQELKKQCYSNRQEFPQHAQTRTILRQEQR